MTALLALVRKDLRLYFSNRRSLIMSIAAPIVIAAFFGSLFGGSNDRKPLRVPVVVTDLDGSEVSQRIVAKLKADNSFDVREADEAAAREEVKKGKARAAIVLPRGLGEALPRAFAQGSDKPGIIVAFDPSQSMMVPMVRGLLSQNVMRSLAAPKASGEPDTRFELPFTLQASEVTSNANSKYNAYAHAFAGMGVQFILFMGIELGVAVLLMRRMGLWKRLRAAPLTRATLLGSRIASGSLIAMILMFIIFAAAIAFFGVRIEGSIAGFLGVVIAFSILTATFGLLIASLGKTPEATRGLAVFATLILVMLGGAWVPSFVFPEWLQAASLFVPTRWAVDGLDAMTWRGLGFDAALGPIAVMLAFSAVFAVIAIAKFDWEE